MEKFNNNKLNTYKVWDISFEAIRNPGTLFSTINYLFSWKWNLKSFNDSDKVTFWDNLIYNFYWNHFIIEYSDLNKINDNILYFTNNFEKIEDSFNSVEFENNLQIPEYIWYFKYDWKQYIILKWCNKFTDEINPEKWIYRWVIIEPDKYFEVTSEVQKVVSKVEDIL